MEGFTRFNDMVASATPMQVLFFCIVFLTLVAASLVGLMRWSWLAFFLACLIGPFAIFLIAGAAAFSSSASAMRRDPRYY